MRRRNHQGCNVMGRGWWQREGLPLQGLPLARINKSARRRAQQQRATRVCAGCQVVLQAVTQRPLHLIWGHLVVLQQAQALGGGWWVGGLPVEVWRRRKGSYTQSLRQATPPCMGPTCSRRVICSWCRAMKASNSSVLASQAGGGQCRRCTGTGRAVGGGAEECSPWQKAPRALVPRSLRRLGLSLLHRCLCLDVSLKLLYLKIQRGGGHPTCHQHHSTHGGRWGWGGPRPLRGEGEAE